MKRAYLYMHIAILLWGFTGILGKAINMSEGMIVWYRLAISAAGLLPLILKNNKELLSKKEFLNIALIGVIVAIHWILFYGAIKLSNVSIALSSFSSISLFTALLDPLSRKEKPKFSEMLLGLAVIFGLYLIFSVQQIYSSGILLAVGSALMGAFFTVMNKKLMVRHNAEVVTFYELLTGFIFLSCLLPVYFHTTETSFQIPGIRDIIYLLILGLVCTSLAFTISLKALEKLDAFTLNLSVNLEPLYSIVLAYFIFREKEILNVNFIMGTAVILTSIIIHSFYKWSRNKVVTITP